MCLPNCVLHNILCWNYCSIPTLHIVYHFKSTHFLHFEDDRGKHSSSYWTKVKFSRDHSGIPETFISLCLFRVHQDVFRCVEMTPWVNIYHPVRKVKLLSHYLNIRGNVSNNKKDGILYIAVVLNWWIATQNRLWTAGEKTMLAIEKINAIIIIIKSNWLTI